MKRLILASMLGVATVLAATGCAVTDRQSSVGQYVDDATISTRVKARMAADPEVSAMRIQVETLNGTVMLSGFAKNSLEKSTAENIARDTKGVKSVRNEIAVRP